MVDGHPGNIPVKFLGNWPRALVVSVNYLVHELVPTRWFLFLGKYFDQ